MHAPPLFVTGTDTDIGKTRYSLALLRELQQGGRTVAAMKPVASGCVTTPLGLRNADAVQLRRQAGLAVPYAWVNPYAFAPPIAPHLAAAQLGQQIVLTVLIDAYRQLSQQASQVVIEGVGGWRVPFNQREGQPELVRAVGAEVILVVGLKLGCINHALLTAEAISRDGCRLRGWVANRCEPGFASGGVIDTLRQHLAAPLLGIMPYWQSLD